MSAKDGGPAFPVSWSDGDGQMVATPGMTLRDYFAGQALGCIDIQNIEMGSLRDYADLAYEMADAMLAARQPAVPAPKMERPASGSTNRETDEKCRHGEDPDECPLCPQGG